jgi:Leucine-rich repeat (LRR) protein
MKNVFILLFLAFCIHINAQIIHFPDANFKNALVNSKCVSIDGNSGAEIDADLNNDGEIGVDEALMVEDLEIDSAFISNLDGLEYFKNLQSIRCPNNKISRIDITPFNKLTFLYCENNLIENIVVDSISQLKILICNNNLLESMNLINTPNLVWLHCDKNKLSELDVDHLTNLTTLTCSYNLLNSIHINGLSKLRHFHCHNNKLESLDLAGLSNLITIICAKNRIKYLIVENHPFLEQLNCSENQITELKIKSCPSLWRVFAYSNIIEKIDFTEIPNLNDLLIHNNKLKSLHLSNYSSLNRLDCSNNEISDLNITDANNLNFLNCQENNFKSIDVSNFKFLENLYCGNNDSLITLNVKNGGRFLNLIFQNNPNLIFICCNEQEIVKIKYEAIGYGLSNCEVNSYCSFTPGGKFYILKGENKYDVDNNGCDEQDIKLPNFKYNITDGSTSGSLITNTTGNYAIPVQEGTYTIIPVLEQPNHFEVTPSSFTVTFPSTSDTITQNFCITPKGIFRQTNITVLPLSPPARPGFEAKYKIVWENVGNQIESGTLNFTYDETLLDYITASQTEDQVADGIVRWNFTNLLPFEKREITVTLKVNRPTDTPAVNAGDKLYLRASILDNIFTLENTVVGSYDPNDKTCLQGDRIKTDMIGKYVDYLIRFENTGNYTTENVVVKDIIDTRRFDVSTLKITDVSHKVYTRIEGNKVEFIFEKIQLPFDDANNDGYIVFKIKTLPTLGLGDSLKNMADIYFDYNFPIRTNEAKTSIAWSKGTTDNTTNINIIPNPVGNILYLQTDEIWTKAEIFDISGRIMRVVSLDSQSIDVSGLESGTYIIKLRNGDILGNVKFVKM